MHTESQRKLPRVGSPVVRASVTMEPVAAAVTVLEVPLGATQAGEHTLATLNSLVAKVNELEALFDRAGVWVDDARSGTREGKIELVLTPNDPADALDACKRFADYLFAALGLVPGATVKVYAAGRSEAPVYELAS